MENNKNTKKWNKEAIWSISSLILLILILIYSLDWMDQVNLDSGLAKRFDWSMMWNFNWRYASIDVLYAIPTILVICLFIFSIYFGMKSIKNTRSGLQKGRMLGIISTTISIAVLVVMILSALFV